jgi:hypothetical protein
MPRPFNRRQALQNAAFLAALARTGNARLAARELGVHRSTFTKRRAKSAAFAAGWEAALAAAHAAFQLAGGPRPPEAVFASGAKQSRAVRVRASGLDRHRAGAPRDDGRGLRTRGGEPTVVRGRPPPRPRGPPKALGRLRPADPRQGPRDQARQPLRTHRHVALPGRGAGQRVKVVLSPIPHPPTPDAERTAPSCVPSADPAARGQREDGAHMRRRRQSLRLTPQG